MSLAYISIFNNYPLGFTFHTKVANNAESSAAPIQNQLMYVKS